MNNECVGEFMRYTLLFNFEIVLFLIIIGTRHSSYLLKQLFRLTNNLKQINGVIRDENCFSIKYERDSLLMIHILVN